MTKSSSFGQKGALFWPLTLRINMNYHRLAFHFLSVRRDYIRAWRAEDWHRTQKERAALRAIRYVIKNVLNNEGRAELEKKIRQIQALWKRAGLKD